MASRRRLIPAYVRCAQALSVKTEDLRGRRLIVANIFARSRQDQQEQAERDGLRRLGIRHLFGVPLFGWACRALSRRTSAGVFGKRIAFEQYYNLAAWVGLSRRGIAA